jgi:type 2 lantibiotic biosynthesis protein LanM
MFKSPEWYRAITLIERINSLRKSSQSKRTDLFDPELARQRLSKWRSHQLNDDSLFNLRLTLDEMTEDEFLYILGEPIEAVRDRFDVLPNWLEVIERAYSCESSGMLPIPSALPRQIHDKDMFLLLGAIEPLINDSYDRLKEEAERLAATRADLPFDPNTIRDVLLTSFLPELLLEIVQVMIKKCSEARKNRLLKGNTPKDRYLDFVKHISRRDVSIEILKEYPVLARRLVTFINLWSDFSIQFLKRLCADWDNIKTTFSPEDDPGVLISDKTGSMGDIHKNGYVLTAKFSSGFKIVYKPRSMAVDVHFQEFLSWINSNKATEPFRILKILDRGDYGWVECVNARSCTTEEEIRRFYKRQGGYLAMLYTLYGEDFHNENLIAEGENPILVDLETLFCPRLKHQSSKAADPLTVSMYDSVLRIGLLPLRLYGDAKHDGIDFSGLAAMPGQITPYELPYIEGECTDEMRIAYKQLEYLDEENNNRPRLNGSEVILWNYIEEIISGFKDIYLLLQRNVEYLLSEEGPLARFADDEIRIILRPTRDYGKLLFGASHPDMLRNSIASEWLFDKLWVRAKRDQYFLKVIPSERDCLLKGIIPRFTTRPGSCDLWIDTNQRIPDFFIQSGLDSVRCRVKKLTDQELTKQLWFVRASFATLFKGSDHTKLPSYKFNPISAKYSPESLIAAARLIGDRLEALSLRSEQGAGWVGLETPNMRHWSMNLLGSDLYDGAAGITLFLSYLGNVTQEERYTDLARAALANIRFQVKQSKRQSKSIGYLGGYGGLIYLLTHLSRLWKEPGLLAEAQNTVEIFENILEEDRQFDIIYGASGAIVSLVNLYQTLPSERTLAVAIKCGEHLVKNAISTKTGKAWITIPGQEPLLGMAHGVAGIAWALLELAALTNNDSFTELAMDALAYERSLFSPEFGNWPDLHRDNSKGRYRITWCNGAAGIGLSRLHCLKILSDDRMILDEINIAITTVLSGGFGMNHSLCHGDLGNLDFLLEACETLNNSRLRSKVNEIASGILASIERQGWLCGTPFGVESPGLMLGISGIGYELLRLADPKIVPSILSCSC